MRVLAIGDIFGNAGTDYVLKSLPRILSEYKIDFCIANGENTSDRNGISRDIAENLRMSGVDVITMGNHTYDDPSGTAVLDEESYVIKPLNFNPEAEGIGYKVVDLGNVKVAVINLIGRVNLPPSNCPFHAVDRVLKNIDTNIVLVDIHAEATSEKIAMAHYLDGRVSAVFGTHTHVQTADERILAGGTGFICDLGMTGVLDSVIGVRKDIIIDFFTKPEKRHRFLNAEGDVWFNGCIFDIDESTGKTVNVERLNFKGI